MLWRRLDVAAAVPGAVREPSDLTDLAKLFAVVWLDRCAGFNENLLELQCPAAGGEMFMWGLGREARHEARFRSHLRSFAGDAKLGRAGGSQGFHLKHQRDRPVVD